MSLTLAAGATLAVAGAVWRSIPATRLGMSAEVYAMKYSVSDVERDRRWATRVAVAAVAALTLGVDSPASCAAVGALVTVACANTLPVLPHSVRERAIGCALESQGAEVPGPWSARVPISAILASLIVAAAPETVQRTALALSVGLAGALYTVATLARDAWRSEKDLVAAIQSVNNSEPLPSTARLVVTPAFIVLVLAVQLLAFPALSLVPEADAWMGQALLVALVCLMSARAVFDACATLYLSACEPRGAIVLNAEEV